MKTIGFGIIGCGMIASWHIRAIKENAASGAALVGVADSNAEAAKKLAAETGVKAFSGAEELISCPDIDAVCICTPSGTHAGLAVAAARAGKHIVVEKPMVLTVADGEKLIAACDKSKVKTEIISQLRTSENVQAVKRAAEGGRLGKLVYGSADMKFYRSQEYYDKGGWRGTKAMDGGGALMNQGIHGLDLLQYIVGGVKSVYAKAKTLARKIEVEDTLSAVLEFENGALGHVSATTSVYPGFARRIEISGERGSIVLEENEIAFWDIKGYPLPDGLKLGRPSQNTSSNPAAFDVRGHALQIADLIEAVRKGGPTLNDCVEGLKSVKIITSIYESAEGNSPVTIK